MKASFSTKVSPMQEWSTFHALLASQQLQQAPAQPARTSKERLVRHLEQSLKKA
jgi:hypothetical protein